MALTEFTEEMASNPEYFKDVSFDTIIEAKDLPFEDKKRLLSYCMKNDILINASLNTNLILLIKGASLEDSVYADKKVIFKDLEEFLDVKSDLKEEIEQFEKNVLRYYFGAFKSLSIKLPDGKIDIPPMYRNILSVADVNMMSKLVNKHGFDFKDAPLVHDAGIILNEVNLQNPLIGRFMKNIMGKLEKNGA